MTLRLSPYSTFAVALSASITLATLSSVCSNAQPPSATPKVVLVGDSIRLSYAPVVKKQLGDSVIVASPSANGGDSNNVLKHVEQWIIREKPDVVHFNCGIHDTKKFKSPGKFQVSPEEYEANLRALVERIRKHTEAVVIFSTTTPILDERAAAARQGRDYELLQESIEQYNAIARKVMTELNVPINDLHAALAEPDEPHTTQSLISNDGVHLTEAGRELAGRQVAAAVQKVLPAKQ